MGHCLKTAAHREWNQPRDKNTLQSTKLTRVGDLECLTSNTKVEFGVCPVLFSFALVQYFLTIFPFPSFEMMMYILSHYTLEGCDLIDIAFIWVCS